MNIGDWGIAEKLHIAKTRLNYDRDDCTGHVDAKTAANVVLDTDVKKKAYFIAIKEKLRRQNFILSDVQWKEIVSNLNVWNILRQAS